MKVMKSTLFILICFWHCSNRPNNTTEPFNLVSVTVRDAGFIDFITADSKIWAITNDSLLVTFDLTNNQKSKIRFSNPLKLSALATDREGNIVVADTENRLGKFENGTWSFTDKLKAAAKAIFFTDQNDAYLLTDDGILDVKQNKSYFPESSLNDQLKLPYVFRRKATSLLDNNGNIWLGYNHGEWGGDIYIFSTIEKRFIEPVLANFELNLNPIFSFTAAPDGIYYSGGLSHLFMTSSYIGKFVKAKAQVQFTDSIDGFSKDPVKKNGHYIGPVSYNHWDDHLYIYSQHGIYKQKLNDKLSKAENWSLVVKPELLWTYGQSNATGQAMNVTKLVTTAPNTFLFLTEENGIGYFNGKTLTMFN